MMLRMRNQGLQGPQINNAAILVAAQLRRPADVKARGDRGSSAAPFSPADKSVLCFSHAAKSWLDLDFLVAGMIYYDHGLPSVSVFLPTLPPCPSGGVETGGRFQEFCCPEEAISILLSLDDWYCFPTPCTYKINLCSPHPHRPSTSPSAEYDAGPAVDEQGTWVDVATGTAGKPNVRLPPPEEQRRVRYLEQRKAGEATASLGKNHSNQLGRFVEH